jgi:hypothetical protein
MKKTMKTELPLMQNTLVLVALTVFIQPPNQAHAQSAIPQLCQQTELQQESKRGESVVPEGSWVYSVVEKLYKQGMVSLPTTRSPFESRKTVTRFEAAVFVVRALDRAHSQLQAEVRPGSHSYGSPLAYDLSDVALMRRLVNEFSSELEVMNLKPAVAADALMRMEKAAASPEGRRPFPDVPSGHWAFSSVERLRQVGIVRGYPGGAFKPGAKTD